MTRACKIMNSFTKVAGLVALAVFLHVCMLISCELSGSPGIDDEPFTYNILPVDLSRVAGIVPMGQVAPPSHTLPTDHIYFYFNMLDPAEDVAVKAIAAGKIRYIIRRSETDFRIGFMHNENVESYFDHVYALSARIIGIVGDLALGTHNLEIPVTAGEIIGYNKTALPALDLGIFDQRRQLPFLNPERYDKTTRYCVDPVAAYTGPEREAFLAKNMRTAKPRGGEICYDTAGTLSGNWFLEGTPLTGATKKDYWPNLLSFLRCNIDPAMRQISYGGTLALSPGGGNFTTGYPFPEDVTPAAGKVKYIVGSCITGEYGVMLVQMLSSSSIKVEIFTGVDIEDVTDFTAAARIYER